MMAYDAKNLYFAFRVKQDKATVRSSVSRRDNIFNDDYVLMYIDTFNDKRQAYIFAFNPLGIQGDGTVTEGRGEDFSIDLVFESKGVLTEDGFTSRRRSHLSRCVMRPAKANNGGCTFFAG